MNRSRCERTRTLLRVSEPADRPALADIARGAQQALTEATERLLPDQQVMMVGRFPVSIALAAAARHWRGRDGGRPPADLIALEEQAKAAAGVEFASAYGRMLLLAELARLPLAKPRLRIPEIAWTEIERSLRVLLEDASTVPADDWRAVSFGKDLRAAQLQWLPYDGMVSVIMKVHPWYLSRPASARERLGLCRYLGPRTARGLIMLGGHEWRGYRELRRRPWQTRMERTAALAVVNPWIAGSVSRSWVNDPALRAISPDLIEKSDGIVASGGYRFRVAMTPHATAQALEKSETRRRLFAEGKYVPGVYATLFKRSELLRWARERWQGAGPGE